MLRALALGLLVLAGGAPPASSQIPASALAARPSDFHPFRDVAATLTQGAVPPKGCTPVVIRQAAALRIAPDLSGCQPSEVEGPIREFLAMEPLVSPASGAAPGSVIVDQSPKPGETVLRGGPFTLILPQPTVPQATSETAPSASGPPSNADGAPPAASNETAPPGPGASTGPAGNLGASPERPTLACPKDWVRTSASSCAPPPPLWRRLFDWFWDGLNPLLVLGLPLAGALAWRLFAPRPTLLTGTPRVAVELRKASPATRFEPPEHAVRRMLALNLVMRASASAVDPPLTVTATRILHDRRDG